MKKFYHIIFMLLLAFGYTNLCFSQTSDQYGQLPDEEAIQRSYKYLQQPLYRVDGLVYQQDELGDYWQVDTTMMIVRVNGNVIPEDVDWKVDVIGFAEIPVPKDIQIEAFAKSLWDLPWVVTASYITYGKFAGDPTCIQKVEDLSVVKEDKPRNHMVTFDLTGRPVSSPTKGICIRNGKMVLVR